VGFPLFAQENYKAQYLELMRNGKFDELKTLLENWETDERENPEMFIAYFNYYVNRNVEVVQSIYRDNSGQQILGPKRNYNKEDVYTGIEYLDRSLKFTPNRLDMYWGKIEVLLEIADYKQAGDVLNNLIKLSPKYNNNWFLSDNRKVPNGEVYFMDYIYRYYDALISFDTPETLNIVKQCAETQIVTYPQSTYGYNILSIYYIMTNKNEEALKQLLLAENVNNNDCTILINIGRLYGEMNNKTKSKEYLDKVIRIGNQNEKQRAQYYKNQYEL
jgi:predicted Zn-dependent protease